VTTIGLGGVSTSTVRATPLVRGGVYLSHVPCVCCGVFCAVLVYALPTPLRPTHPH
jgi:hypothetical protein